MSRTEKLEAIKQHFLREYVEDPMDGTSFDCDILHAIDALQRHYGSVVNQEPEVMLFPFSSLNNPDYQQGWDDCRGYQGEAETSSRAYHKGFGDCLEAYHKALSQGKGWDARSSWH